MTWAQKALANFHSVCPPAWHMAHWHRQDSPLLLSRFPILETALSILSKACQGREVVAC